MDLSRKKKTNKNKRVKLFPRLMWDLQYLYSKYLLPILNDGVSVRSGRTGYLGMADGDRKKRG